MDHNAELREFLRSRRARLSVDDVEIGGTGRTRRVPGLRREEVAQLAGVSTDYYIRLTLRRIAPGNVGMNLHYEVADSQGRSPYKNTGTWFGVSDSNDWQTWTWHVKDACFAKMWGHDIAFVPEQSQPFVLGTVEVSTEPFPAP